jgi:subtilisin
MDDERLIGIPGDTIVDESLIYPMTTDLPSSAWHVPENLRVLHAAGVDGRGVTVAVNDTGIGTHPFIQPIKAQWDFTGGNSPMDRHGHGSHCAGIVRSVAPGCGLINAKVLSDSGSGSTTGINAGRVWAAEQGADVISESLGDGGGPPIAADLAAYDRAYAAGVRICTAALGNAGYNGRSTIGRPGSYSDKNHGIAAMQSDWRSIAGFSSGGPQAAYAAPGAGIVSCRPVSGWVLQSGTSMACPWHAGYLAICISWRRRLGMVELVGPAQWTAWHVDNGLIIDLGTPGWDPRFGHGRVDYVKAFDFMGKQLELI